MSLSHYPKVSVMRISLLATSTNDNTSPATLTAAGGNNSDTTFSGHMTEISILVDRWQGDLSNRMILTREMSDSFEPVSRLEEVTFWRRRLPGRF